MTRFQRFTHNVLGWHRRGHELGFDGLTLLSRCAVCGVRIGQDSQGNWFDVPEPPAGSPSGTVHVDDGAHRCDETCRGVDHSALPGRRE